MQFIVTSILLMLTNVFITLPANTQPTPEMSHQWKLVVEPKIKKNLDKELSLLHTKPSAKTVVLARAYLEKDGTVKNLRIDKTEEESDLKQADLLLVENALLSAIKKSTPLPYGNNPNSLLKHIGLFVEYYAGDNKLEAGMTHPEDCPNP